MENFYSVSELITIFKISKETFYKVKGKNKQFFEDNSRKVREDGKNGKPIFKYSQSVFDFFASQYGTEEAAALLENASARGTRTEAPETPPESFFSPADDVKPTQEDKNALQAKIEALEAKLEKREKETNSLSLSRQFTHSF